MQQGRTVLVLPDNDDAGREHARKVAASLHGVADSVAVLDLPDLPPKGDVSDWLARGGTADRLAELRKQASPFKPARDKPKGQAEARPDALADAAPNGVELTHDGVAQAFAARVAGRFVYDHTAQQWFRWK